MQVRAYEAAFGPCAACGEETHGSKYWVGPGPVAMMFVPEHNKPLCGPECSLRYYEEHDR